MLQLLQKVVRVTGSTMWRIFQYFFSPRVLKPAISQKYKFTKYYDGPETPISEISSHFNQFGGGSIILNCQDNTGIALLCLNQPERKNAISGKMMKELLDSIQSLENWTSGKGLILYGSNHNFCSGGDLNFVRQQFSAQAGFSMATLMQHALERFQRLPLITLALIEGAGAIGGGSELAVACDFRLIASNSAGLGFLHSCMGITPAWGGCTRLVHLVGYTMALDLMTTGRMVSGQEALGLNLADGIVSSENALEEAKQWLMEKTKCDITVIKALKAMVQNAVEMDYHKSLSEEKRLFAPLWGGTAQKLAINQHFKRKEERNS